MNVIGTPDNQRGIVNAQSLLASVPAGTISVDVNVPPNTTTLMVINAGASIGATNLCYCLGQTSGTLYPGSLRQYSSGIAAFWSRFFTVSPVLDSVITVKWGTAPTVGWYVIAMSGVNVVDDPAMDQLVSRAGVAPSPYGIMVYGSDGTNAQALSTDVNARLRTRETVADTVFAALGTTNTQFMPAPPTGFIYRCFSLYCYCSVAGDAIYLTAGVGGGVIGAVAAPVASRWTLGQPMGPIDVSTSLIMFNSVVGSFTVSMAYKLMPTP